MLHLVHPALSRAAALDPYRFRHYALVASASAVALALLFSNGVSSALAMAEDAELQTQPVAQQFIPAPAGSAPEVTLTAPAEPVAASLSAAELAAVDPGAEAVEPPVSDSAARLDFTIDVRPPLVYPVGAGAPVGSSFGPRDQACGACSTMHQGVDWNPGRGTPIVAIADGVVSKIGAPGSTLGVYLTIDHVIGGQRITSVYGHMEAGSMPYQVGDVVRVGDPVGRVGSTGVTTAPHLHFELRIGGTAINPVPWMIANGAQ